MAQKLEAIRGGGGSIKVGTTGKISALMSRELESAKTAPQMPSTSSFVTTSSDEASSSSGTGSFRNHKYDKSVEGAPTRKRPAKKGHGVEIVDIKCGVPNKLWPKKLSFSKLSDSNI